MSAAVNFDDIRNWNTGCQLSDNFLTEKAILIGISKKYFFQKIQLGFFKSSDGFIITSKEKHFIKADQIEIAVTDIVLNPFKTVDGSA